MFCHRKAITNFWSLQEFAARLVKTDFVQFLLHLFCSYYFQNVVHQHFCHQQTRGSWLRVSRCFKATRKR